ncbi:hypothetical protein [Allocoleopsis sp.]|uniref:hypothetical protein n=1 Tax=Allocoleopsis sp. TaxID=3088169 RepID=UPI002FD52555
MRPKKRLDLLFNYSINIYAIILGLLALITVILAIRLVDTPNIVMAFGMGLFLVIYGLTIGFSAPGSLILAGLEHFFHLSFNSDLTSYIEIIISLIPWIIWGFFIEKKQKKWIVLLGLFISTYMLCGSLYLVLVMTRGT